MRDDPIINEIRKYRDEYAAKFNYDMDAICKDIRKRQATSGHEVVSRPSKRTAEDQCPNVDVAAIQTSSETT